MTEQIAVNVAIETIKQAGREAIQAGEVIIGALTDERDSARSALKTAISHIEHMAAWIGKQRVGYCFESIGEDMPSIKAALGDTPSVLANHGKGD